MVGPIWHFYNAHFPRFAFATNDLLTSKTTPHRCSSIFS
jgi:hypothetical protein